MLMNNFDKGILEDTQKILNKFLSEYNAHNREVIAYVKDLSRQLQIETRSNIKYKNASKLSNDQLKELETFISNNCKLSGESTSKDLYNVYQRLNYAKQHPSMQRNRMIDGLKQLGYILKKQTPVAMWQGLSLRDDT